jgi:hypothetical protein
MLKNPVTKLEVEKVDDMPQSMRVSVGAYMCVCEGVSLAFL